MKKIALMLIAASFSVAAFAQAKPIKVINCAVMTGSKVNIADATKKKMYHDYKGNRYFFCCAGCPEAFKKSPAKFAKNAHIKLPKKKTS